MSTSTTNQTVSLTQPDTTSQPSAPRSLWSGRLRSVSLVAAAVVGLAFIAYIPSCALFGPPRVKSPYTDQLATEAEIVAQKAFNDQKVETDRVNAERKRQQELDLEAKKQQAAVESLRRSAEASLKAISLDQEKDRVVAIESQATKLDELTKTYNETVAAKRAAWDNADANQSQAKSTLDLKFDAAIADLQLQQQQRGVLGSVIDAGIGFIPGANSVAVKDSQGNNVGIAEFLKNLLGLTVAGGVGYRVVTAGTRTKQAADQSWDESAAVASQAKQREDTAWEDGYKRAQDESKNNAMTQMLQLLIARETKQEGGKA